MCAVAVLADRRGRFDRAAGGAAHDRAKREVEVAELLGEERPRVFVREIFIASLVK